jgi:hypothetical protein
MARITLTTRVTNLENQQAEILSILRTMQAQQAPASKPKAAKKVAAKVQPKAVAKPTKGAQTRETLKRSDWNRTLCTKARLAGARPGKADESVYSAIQRDWTLIQARREAGFTPDEVLATYV